MTTTSNVLQGNYPSQKYCYISVRLFQVAAVLALAVIAVYGEHVLAVAHEDDPHHGGDHVQSGRSGYNKG